VVKIGAWIGIGMLGAAALLSLPTPPVQAQVAMARAEVVHVDRAEGAAGRVTLKHTGIRNLDMPPMTMVFHVAKAAMLDDLAPGDRVRFTADRIEGRYTVTLLHKEP
jgi:Cu/Ag efflux protein CusF